MQERFLQCEAGKNRRVSPAVSKYVLNVLNAYFAEAGIGG